MRLARLTLLLLAAATALLAPSRAWSDPSEGTVTITADDGSVTVTSDDDNGTIRSEDGTVTITPSTGISTITSSDGKVTITTENAEPPTVIRSEDGTVTIVAEGAEAAAPVTKIILGSESPLRPPPSPVRANAVEDYLAARQRKNLDAPKGTHLLAFDFPEEIEPTEDGRFHVSVYLLFADEWGRIVESRDERLTFTSAPVGWRCVSHQPTGSIVWRDDAVLDAAAFLGVSDALRETEVGLREWSAQGARGYSLADVTKDSDGRVVVQCLRYTAEPGQRGVEVVTDPLLLSRGRGTPPGDWH